jgi:hypothetical protein
MAKGKENESWFQPMLFSPEDVTMKVRAIPTLDGYVSLEVVFGDLVMAHDLELGPAQRLATQIVDAINAIEDAKDRKGGLDD